MATLNIEGRRVTVDDGFLKLSSADQQATVEEIASSFAAPPPDKYQQAAIDEAATMKAQGIDQGAGYTRRLAHGVTMGADNTILAAATTPLEMIKRGTLDPREGYSYAKAREDQIMNDARANTGALGTATEILGGGVAGGALAPFGASRFLSSAPSLLGRSGAMAADGAALGGFAGFNEGNGFADRMGHAATGALLGGGIGGVLPGVGALAKGVASPFISNIMAQINPRGFAEKQVARGMMESGRPTGAIADDVVNAANEGQGMFTVADAMGNSGQRMLSTVTRAPGEGRTAAVNFLEGRQGSQGRRVSNALAEGFDAPETALQTEARLTAQRGADADAAYGAVRNDAGSVDVTGAIAHIDRTLGPAADQMLSNSGSAAANDSVEAVLLNFRNKLARTNPDDFASIQRIRGDMADAAQNAAQSGYGNKARLIRGAVGQLDTAMENASAGHLAANRGFAQASRDIEAVQTGRQAATRGRTEDTIPTFEALGPNGQQAFRSGYVDPHIGNTQGAAFGVNKARPFMNDAFAAEAEAMAPGNPLMQRRLGREQTMFETRNQALGNSKTAENLADDAAMGVSPTLVGQVLSGNWGGAARSVIAAGQNAVTGNTPAVRAAVADILLQRGANVTPAALDRMVGETIRKMQTVQRLAMNSARVGAGAAAQSPEAFKKSKRTAIPLFSR